MARQSGIIKIQGTVGGMTFYRSSKDGDLVREKGGVSKDRIQNDPAFARTRENGSEFGAAAISGKMMRDSTRPMLLTASDGRVTSRLTTVMTKIQKLDATSVRGKRNVGTAITSAQAKALLKNFNFNINANLASVLFKPFTVNTTSGVITITGLVPQSDIAYPTGATHIALSGAFANVNFATGVIDTKYTNVTNMVINGTASTVTLTPTATPAGTGTKLFLLRIEFFQLINGVQYTLKNGLYNALAVVEIA